MINTYTITRNEGGYFTATLIDQRPPVIGIMGATAGGRALACNLVNWPHCLPAILETETRRLVCLWPMKTEQAKRAAIETITAWLEGEYVRIPDELRVDGVINQYRGPLDHTALNETAKRIANE